MGRTRVFPAQSPSLSFRRRATPPACASTPASPTEAPEPGWSSTPTPLASQTLCVTSLSPEEAGLVVTAIEVIEQGRVEAVGDRREETRRTARTLLLVFAATLVGILVVAAITTAWIARRTSHEVLRGTRTLAGPFGFPDRNLTSS